MGHILLGKSHRYTPCRDGRDPRFDSLSGTLDTDRFRKRYAFLYDEQLPAERDDIKYTLQVSVCEGDIGASSIASAAQLYAILPLKSSACSICSRHHLVPSVALELRCHLLYCILYPDCAVAESKER